jgi:hypothetical protein
MDPFQDASSNRNEMISRGDLNNECAYTKLQQMLCSDIIQKIANQKLVKSSL